MPASPLPRLPRLLSIAALLAAPPLRAGDDPLDRVGKVATEWVRTRSETVRLETDWAAERETLGATIAALEERVRTTEADLAQSQELTAHARGELDELERRNEQAQKDLAAVEARLRPMAAGLAELRSALPPRLQAALELPYRSLANADLPVGDRMQFAMTILNRCVQFNRVITTDDEVVALPGEPAPKSLEVIYWGLSHGYALDRVAGKAWRGAPGPQGWQWTAEPAAAAGVARLIAMATDRADPHFVAVPARLNHPATR